MSEQENLKAFLCHSSEDSSFVTQVGSHLKHHLEEVFTYEENPTAQAIPERINHALQKSNVMVIFHRGALTDGQKIEVNHVVGSIMNSSTAKKKWKVMIVPLFDANLQFPALPEELTQIDTMPIIKADSPEELKRICPTLLSIAECKTGCHFIPSQYAKYTAQRIIRELNRNWHGDDDLPANPHLFKYEKDIIDFYTTKLRLGDKIYGPAKDTDKTEVELEKMREKLLDGCPPEWPEIARIPHGAAGVENPLNPEIVGEFAGKDLESGQDTVKGAKIVTAALSKYHQACQGDSWDRTRCMMHQKLTFEEARPRKVLHYPRESKDQGQSGARRGHELRVAILVSGGIAPGLNAVIDGIVQRHWTYCLEAAKNSKNTISMNRYSLQVYGLRNGLRAFERPGEERIKLAEYNHHTCDELIKPILSAEHANDGGCILGTSRVDDLMEDELIAPDKRISSLQVCVNQLRRWQIDILYVIGGDGSMKAAHALWSMAKEIKYDLSVIGVPKTMDNDILWMWQSFGFLSAVEKAREIIQHLHTEVKSNPRLCVVQLFGSDSGFVVSHAVLASATGQCDAAVIPEVPFTMKKLALHVRNRMLRRGEPIPHGLVVMAETAIPLDAVEYLDMTEEDPRTKKRIPVFTEQEKERIKEFCDMRLRRGRIQGQTDDLLRSTGLKIVSRGLLKLLPDSCFGGDDVPDLWHKHLRVVTNEPRHVLRSIPPSCTDVIMGQRLGTLAVDNAMAGFTDFMISQWLTEYVLVPLKLVVLGRKRIPPNGIFWKSVCGKTGMTDKMYDDASLRRYDPATAEEYAMSNNQR